MLSAGVVGIVMPAILQAKDDDKLEIDPNIPPAKAIKLKTAQTGIIMFSGPITDRSANQMIEMIFYYMRNKVQSIWIAINSTGGSVHAMMSFYNFTRNLDVEINTYVSGAAESSALLLMLCGKRRLISPKSYVMMHNISANSPTPLTTERDFDNKKEAFAVLDATFVQIMSDVSGTPMPKIRSLMADETYLNAKQVLSLGFATEILDLKSGPDDAVSTLIDDRMVYHQFFGT